MRNKVISLPIALLGSIFASLSLATTKCDSPYQGQKLNRAQILTIIAQQKGKLINLCGTDLSGQNLKDLRLDGANLSGADVSRAQLQRTSLRKAYLVKTYFRWSNLTQVDMHNANLKQANLQETQMQAANLRQADLSEVNARKANLNGSYLIGANLRKAIFEQAQLNDCALNWLQAASTQFSYSTFLRSDLSHAQLTNADFSHANLSNAHLNSANLSHANLSLSILKNTHFSHTNFMQTLYQPQLETLPNLIDLTTSLHFSDIQFELAKGAPILAELRTAYKRVGLRSMERKLTAMLKTKEMQHAWQNGGLRRLEAAFTYVFFYLTSQYGAEPGRPLLLFLLFVILLSGSYGYALIKGDKKNAIFVVWPPSNLYRQPSHQLPQQSLYFIQQLSFHALGQQHSWLRIVRIALFFSVLSAFQIGWRELNVGNWISRLQTREYRLHATGWVRRVAGLQSLLSAYLIVLWALTYFGRPFEW